MSRLMLCALQCGVICCSAVSSPAARYVGIVYCLVLMQCVVRCAVVSCVISPDVRCGVMGTTVPHCMKQDETRTPQMARRRCNDVSSCLVSSCLIVAHTTHTQSYSVMWCLVLRCSLVSSQTTVVRNGVVESCVVSPRLTLWCGAVQ